MVLSWNLNFGVRDKSPTPKNEYNSFRWIQKADIITNPSSTIIFENFFFHRFQIVTKYWNYFILALSESDVSECGRQKAD